MINKQSLLITTLFLFGLLNVHAQLLLDEPFNYGTTTGDSLTNPAIGGANWKRHSGAGGPLMYIPTSLTYAGYPGSGSGGAMTFAHASVSKEDANRALASVVNSGSVYVSFLLNVTASGGGTGDYAFHLNDSAGNGISSIFRAKMFLKDGGSAGTFKIGFSKGGAATVAAFSTVDYNLNQTYLVAVKYVFNTVSAADDSVYATVISSGVPSTEPLYSLVCTDISQSDLAKIKSVCFRQGTVGTGGATVDGLRVATNWNDLINGSVLPTVPPVTGLMLSGLTKRTARISFTKNAAYDAAQMKVVVFMKKDSAIIQGTPNKAANNYSASTDLAVTGTPYQHDTAAFCVLNGDTHSVIVNNLVPGSSYHLLAYVLKTGDSLYSTAAIASGTSSATPGAVTSVSFTSGGQTSALIKWKKPVTFDASNSTVLVFAKATTAITGTLTLPTASQYLANNLFTAAPQSLGGDAAARCIYNGTGDSMTVTGLTVGTTYYVSVYVGRNADSTYAGAVSGSGSTDGLVAAPPAVSVIQFTGVATNAMTVNWNKPAGYVDSSMTTLVFMKAGSAITTGVNTYTGATYLDQSTFGTGSRYQHDSLGYCVYKGDSAKVMVTNLAPYTGYFVTIYVLRDSDTAYSSAVSSDKITLETPPSSVTGALLVGISQTSARISWVKQSDYNNTKHTTLVFLKEGTINTGSLGRGVSYYNASTAFTSGTRFDVDSNAYCVFKSDTNFVTVTGLKSQSAYQAIIIVMRDGDSVQTAGTLANGGTQGPPPFYSIKQVNKVNPLTGVPDSLGVKVTVRGIVYGFNQRATGIQLVIRDTTGGLTLFNSSKNFGYTTVAEGDELEVSGSVATSRGLAEIVLDTIIVRSSGKPLKQPVVVSKVEEQNENDLIRINAVKFITPPAGGIWPTASTNISVTNALNDTIVIRILSTFPIAGKPLPTTPTFTVIGLGVQFSTSTAAPFAFNGYQIFPRTQADIIGVPVVPTDSLSSFQLLSPNNNDTIVLTNTNLGDTVILGWTQSINSNGIDSTTYTFILDTLGEDFSNPRFELPTGSASIVPLTKSDIYGMAISNGISSGVLFAGIWEVKAVSQSLVRYSSTYRNIFVLNNVTTGIIEQSRLDAVNLYPNPAVESVTIWGLLPHKDVVTIYGLTGRVELEAAATETAMILPTSSLSAGVYFVKIQSGEAIAIKKLVIR